VTTYEAPIAIPAGGTVTLTATSMGNSGSSVSAVVFIITPKPILVTFAAPPPPPTIQPSSSAFFTAKVINDPVGNGVDWTASCGSPGACGTFAPAHTAAGDTTTYTSPAAVPSGSTVMVTATSTTDPSMSHSAMVIVTNNPPAALLAGTFTFVVSGTDANGRNCLAGVLQADGMGNITAGEQDVYNFKIGHSHDSFTGFYSVQPDGRGTLMLNTGNFKLGSFGTEVLAFALVSPSHALLTQFDPSASSSGSLDLQTLTSFSSSTLSGGYALALYGLDLSTGMFMGSPSFLQHPFSLGGVLNVSGPGSISGAGSTVDSNDNGALNLAQGVSGSITPPDAQGRVQITLSLSSIPSNLVLVGYISDASHVKLVEIDGTIAAAAGTAIGQGVKTGTFTQPGAFSGSFVLAASGATPGMLPPALPLAVAASFASDGVASLQIGLFDLNAAGTASNGIVTGTYSVDPAGTGRVMVNLSGISAVPSTYAVYLTGTSDPSPAIELDATGVTSGLAYSQDPGPFSGLNFQGPYALNFTLVQPDGTAQDDTNGQALADGVGNFAATWDFSGNNQRRPNVPATGVFMPQPTGRFTGSMAASLVLPDPRRFSYYVVSNSQVVFIETDALGVALGIFELQLPPL